ncbi:MAG: hypothetical protein HY678_06575 [Chloroflexi bacterium]|nr:hypothetical protein [Chloroflexota bacterium]
MKSPRVAAFLNLATVPVAVTLWVGLSRYLPEWFWESWTWFVPATTVILAFGTGYVYLGRMCRYIAAVALALGTTLWVFAFGVSVALSGGDGNQFLIFPQFAPTVVLLILTTRDGWLAAKETNAAREPRVRPASEDYIGQRVYASTRPHSGSTSDPITTSQGQETGGKTKRRQG